MTVWLVNWRGFQKERLWLKQGAMPELAGRNSNQASPEYVPRALPLSQVAQFFKPTSFPSCFFFFFT